MPFLCLMKTVDLINAESLQPIRRPVSTSIGLLEEVYFKALQAGGLLHWPNGQKPPKEEETDTRAQRSALGNRNRRDGHYHSTPATRESSSADLRGYNNVEYLPPC